jgi:uncharacterized protein YukE
MPQAIVDPEELRRFARNLKKFTTLVEEGMGQLNGQMSTLSKTWRDQEQRKFMEAFEEHVRGLSRFLEMTDEHVPYLLRKAEIIEQYLRQG